MLDVVLAAAAVLTIAVYARGLARAPASLPGSAPARILTFAAGFAAALAAVASPLEHAAGRTLTVHMAQHVVLLTVVPPLLVVSRPVAVLAHGLPDGWRLPARRRGAALARRMAPSRALPVVAVAAWVGAMAVWHLPGPFDLAVHDGALHALEHVTFLATSVGLWWAVLRSATVGRPGTGLACLFAAGLACTALGALLVLARTPWYPAYVHGSRADALADQQLAGIVMWGFANVALVVASAATIGLWLLGLERRSPARLRPEGLS